MGARKSALDRQFSYDCLGDAELLAREAAGRIAERAASEAMAKAGWTRHGLDILRVRETVKHGHFLAWVKHETPFGERVAQMMAAAARMLREHLKSENFADLPPLDKVVTYMLAAEETPTAVRDEYLPRLLAGEKGLRKLVNAALKPQVADPVEEVAETGPAVAPRVPSRDMVAAVESISESAFRTMFAALAGGAR